MTSRSRPVRAEDLPGLSGDAARFFLRVRAEIDDAARGSEERVRQRLREHGFAANAPALAFDAAHGGLWHTTWAFEPPPIPTHLAGVSDALMLGIAGLLGGAHAEALAQALPPDDAVDDEDRVPAEVRAMTPIGLLLGASPVAVLMDADGHVHWYSHELGEHGYVAESGVAFLEDHARRQGGR